MTIMPAPFSLIICGGRYSSHSGYLRRNLLRARRLIAAPLRELSLVLVSDSAMADLHQRFMNLPGPTDVLTFPVDLDARQRPISGEVVVCVPYARRTAESLGIALKNELLLYALHGMLHLCGFDDRTDREFAQMHRKEDRILRQLGVGAVFSPDQFSPGRSRNQVRKGMR